VVADGRGCICGGSHCPSVPSGSHAHRFDAQASSRPSIRIWPSADEAATAHLRQRSGQRRPAAAAQEARDRSDPPSSVESQKADAPRWSFATPLPPPLDDRKDCRLALTLPRVGYPIRVPVQDVPGVSEGRLPDDHPSQLCKLLPVTRVSSLSMVCPTAWGLRGGVPTVRVHCVAMATRHAHGAYS